MANQACQSARELDAGDVSLCPATRCESQTDSWICGVGLHRQGGKHCPGRRNREGENRISVWSAAEGAGEWLPLSVRQGPGLFDEMYASLADRSSRQLLKRLTHLDVLLIDEFGYLNLKPEQSNIFFKLMEERYRQHSTIITTNLVYDEWPNFLGNRPMVEALLSRLRHFCHTVTINGPSLRDPQG